MSNIVTLSVRLDAAASLVRAYAGGDANRALAAWADAACELYKQELVEVDPEGLAALQAQVRQLEALRLLLNGALQTNGRI